MNIYIIRATIALGLGEFINFIHEFILKFLEILVDEIALLNLRLNIDGLSYVPCIDRKLISHMPIN